MYIRSPREQSPINMQILNNDIEILQVKLFPIILNDLTSSPVGALPKDCSVCSAHSS